jgi:DNA-binding response OmpR family regulator
MLTARDDGMEPVAGLEAGADDRVVRPGQARMLDGRIRASPRRIGGGRRLAGGERLDPRRPDDLSVPGNCGPSPDSALIRPLPG